MTETRRYVVEPSAEPGGVPYVRVQRLARWQFIGAREHEPTADDLRDDLMLGLRDAGVGPEPIVSYSDDDESGRVLHLDWPDLGTHAIDPDYARVLALASLPLFRECPELDSTEPDVEAIAAAEREVAEDREKQRRQRRVRKRARLPEPERKPTKAPPKPSPTIFEVERTASGWKRSRPRPRLTLRARWWR